TYGGEALSLAAARATMTALAARAVPRRLARHGGLLRRGVAELLAAHGIDFVRLVGNDCRTMLVFDAAAADPLLRNAFVRQELCRRGIRGSGFHPLSAAHGEPEIAALLHAYDQVLPELAEAVALGAVGERLLGRPVEPMFRRTQGFDLKPVAAREAR